MKRKALKDLKKWLISSIRKPLILRGARQVGKSTLVHLFAQEEKLELFEFNFEVDKLNSVSDEQFKIQKLLDEIQLKKQKKLTSKSLIFFDEIQESPQLLKYLRYFYEQRPDLIVISAGSLLEIALHEANFSFPVGRVEFYHLSPMTFSEFLCATGNELIDEKLSQLDFSPALHHLAIEAMKNFYYVGGMPAVVNNFAQSNSLVEARTIQQQIIQTYQADFPKYNKRINIQRIARIFNALALQAGKKVIYSKLDPQSGSREIKRVVELLIDARVILPCIHSDGNAIPLLGESDAKVFKSYFLDIGLLNALLRLDLDAIESEFEGNFNTKGVIAEQYIAQHLSNFYPPFMAPILIYHLRDKRTQKAEIDFLIESKDKIYPIEVKSTAKGHLKSLKYFCEQKNAVAGIKISLDEFSVEPYFTSNSSLINFPLYAIDYLKDYIESKFIS